MNKREFLKRVTAILMAVLICFQHPVSVLAEGGNVPEGYTVTTLADWEYSYSDEYCILYEYNGNAEKIYIPSNLDGEKIAVAEGMFSENTLICEVYFEPDVYIESLYRAFYNCTNLKKVVLPKNVIQGSAESCFYGCTNLIEVTSLPEGVTNLNSAFYGCSSLKKAPEIPATVKEMHYTFHDCSSLQSAPDIPASVTDLNYTFSGCTSLLNAPQIDASVEFMYHTYENCTNMVNGGDIPDSVTSLVGTYIGCESLVETPVFPNELVDMDMAFNDCVSLEKVQTIPDSVEIMNYTFSGCKNLVKCPDLPENLLEMRCTFSYCENLKEIPTIPDQVQDMYATFEYCTNISSAADILIPATVTEFEWCFTDCVNLMYPPQISSDAKIGSMDQSFYGCETLVEAPLIPDTVTSMVDCFRGCYSLVKPPIISENSMLTNMYAAFLRCKSLEVPPLIPQYVTNLDYAFCECESLEYGPELPRYAATLNSTFEGCSSMKSIKSIPAGVTEMNACFEGCKNLQGTVDLYVVSEEILNQLVWIFYDSFTEEEPKLMLNYTAHNEDYVSYLVSEELYFYETEDGRKGYSSWYDGIPYPRKYIGQGKCIFGYSPTISDLPETSDPMEEADIIPEKTYLFHVEDEIGAPLQDCEITYQNSTYTTDEKGNVFVPYDVNTVSEIVIKKEPYATIWQTDYVMDTQIPCTVFVMKETEFHFYSAYMNVDAVGTAYNLLNEPYNVNKKQNGIGYDMKVMLSDNAYKDKITQWSIRQNGEPVIYSTDGRFLDIDFKKFDEGGEITLHVFYSDAEGNEKEYEEPLFLKVRSIEETATIDLEPVFDTLGVPAGVPLIGGTPLEFRSGTVTLGVNFTQESLCYTVVPDEISFSKGPVEYALKIRGKLEIPWDLYDKGMGYTGTLVLEFFGEAGAESQVYPGIVVGIEGSGGVDAEGKLIFDAEKTFAVEATISPTIGLLVFAGLGIPTTSIDLYGSGSIDADFDLMKHLIYPQTLGLSGNVGIRVRLLDKEVYNAKLLSGYYAIIERKNTEQTADTVLDVENNANWLDEFEQEFAVAVLNAAEEPTASVDRNYLEERSEWEGYASSNWTSVLQWSTYSGISPEMVTCNGKTYMFFVDDAGEERTDANRTQLVYSVYDPVQEMWSEPVQICNNGTADYEPTVCTDGKLIYVVWQDAKEELTEGLSIEETGAKMELSAAVINTEEGSCEAIGTFTENGIYEQNPSVSEENGTITVSWYENSDNSIWGASGKNSLHTAVYEEGVWTLTDAAEAEGAVYGSVSGVLDNEWCQVTLECKEGGVASVNGSELYISTKDGKKKLIDNGLSDLGSFGYVNGKSAYIWLKDAALYYITDINGTPTVLTNMVGVVNNNYRFVSDEDGNMAILYAKHGNNKSDLVVRQYDKANEIWGTYEEESYMDSYVERMNGCFLDGTLVLSYSRTTITDQETFKGTSDFLCLILKPEVQLNINDINYDGADFIIGEEMEVTVLCENTGSASLKNPVIEIISNDTVISSQKVETVIPSGEEAKLVTRMIVPEVEGSTEFRVNIKEDEENESILSHGYFYGGMAYLTMDVTEYYKGDTEYVRVIVKNTGCDATEAYIAFKNEEYSYWEYRDTGLIKPGEAYQLSIPLEAILDQPDETALITVELGVYGDSMNEEIPTKTITIRAIDKHEITFESNCEQKFDAQIISNGSFAVLPVPEAREGYEFTGWYMDEEFTDLWLEAWSVYSDMTLYGKWEHIHVTETEYIDSTCTEDGYYIVKCTICGEVFEEEIIESYGHTILESVIVTEPTYTTTGLEKGICEDCGEEVTEEIGMIELEFMEFANKINQLTIGDTFSLYLICLPVDPTAGEVIWSSSNTNVAAVDENGKVTAVGEGISEIKASLGDSFVSCEVTVVKNETHEHYYGDWITVIEPTYTTAGLEKRICEGCGNEETRESPKLELPDDILPFTDVKESDWYYDYVKYANENGLMTGTSETTFAPKNNLTRAQFAMILYRMKGEPEVEYSEIFSDVPEGTWYTNAVLWASEDGVVLGDNGKFRPNDNITREQMALMMYRYADENGYDISETADLGRFSDISMLNSWAKDAMEWAVGSVVITGNANGTLNPRGNATRAECATIIMRFTEKYTK